MTAEDYPDYRFTIFRDVLALGYPGLLEYAAETGVDKHFTGTVGVAAGQSETVNLYTVPAGRILFVAYYTYDFDAPTPGYTGRALLRRDDVQMWQDYGEAVRWKHTVAFHVPYRLSAGETLNIYIYSCRLTYVAECFELPV